MNGPIAQAVALTCHGNAVIRGLSSSSNFMKNSTCQFCDSVTFVQLANNKDGGSSEIAVADTPDEWLGRLSAKRAQGLMLYRTPQNDPNFPDRLSAGFVGGGGTWTIEVILNYGRTEYWIARWHVWNRDVPQQKIRRVTYGLIGTGVIMMRQMRTLEQVKIDFQEALEDIHDFSRRNDCGGFTGCFADALAALKDPKADIGYHNDLYPNGALPEIAASLLKAAMASWV
ncbi:MAG TPA: hypothetical protein VI756_22760, partial [Blastocatellia bacterium]